MKQLGNCTEMLSRETDGKIFAVEKKDINKYKNHRSKRKHHNLLKVTKLSAFPIDCKNFE